MAWALSLKPVTLPVLRVKKKVTLGPRSSLLTPPPGLYLPSSEPAPGRGWGELGSGDWVVPAPSNSSLFFLPSSPTSLPRLSNKGECPLTPPGGGGASPVIWSLLALTASGAPHSQRPVCGNLLGGRRERGKQQTPTPTPRGNLEALNRVSGHQGAGESPDRAPILSDPRPHPQTWACRAEEAEEGCEDTAGLLPSGALPRPRAAPARSCRRGQTTCAQRGVRAPGWG